MMNMLRSGRYQRTGDYPYLLKTLLPGVILVGSLLTASPVSVDGAVQAFSPDQGAAEDGGVLVRVNGDVTLDEDEREAVVVVVNGDATISGIAAVVVVTNGTATLTGATVTELFVVGGTALLQDGTVVTGNVQLINADIAQAEDTAVEGKVYHDTGLQVGLMVFGFIISLGIAVVILLSGLLAAAVAPHSVRAVGGLLAHEFGKTVLATLIVWIGFPLLAVAALATLVGIPAGIGIFVFLLPTMGFLGYLITGIRIGDHILGRIRRSQQARDQVQEAGSEAWHPYQAALVGLIVLLLAAWVPVVGPIVSPLASLLGSGALVLHAWKVARQSGPETGVANPQVTSPHLNPSP